MTNDIVKKKINNLLVLANVEVNGDRPWVIQVHNAGFVNRDVSEQFNRAYPLDMFEYVGFQDASELIDPWIE